MSERDAESAEQPTVLREYVTICELTEDDPHPESDMEAGDAMIVPGNLNEQETVYSLYGDVELACDVLAILRPSSPMGGSDIMRWGRKRIVRTNLFDRLANTETETQS